MKIVIIPPKNKLDYLAETIIEGLYKHGYEIYSSDMGNGVLETDVYSDDEIIEHSKSCDYIFVIWGKKVGGFPGPKYYLLDRINRRDRVIFIDGSEWTSTGHPIPNQVREAKNNPSLRRGEPWIDEFMYNNSNWYFKRECYKQDLEKGIIPLLFGAVDRHFLETKVEKKYDLFCSYGQMNDGLRLETYNFCKQLQNEGYNVVLSSGMGYEEFKKKLKSSWIGVDAWGGGDCCARLWEILSNQTMAICQKYRIEFPDDFTDGENIVYYSSIYEFETKVRHYLNNREEIERISNNGYEHLLGYHTSSARVKYIMDKVNENIRN